MKDYCKYVDVFFGNGEVDHFPEDGLASKWFYIKALCGNTTPHPVYPFGKMSVGAYSGGYPTGYGTHYPNSCGGIEKLWENMKIRGFSHLHQSGTGAIGYYYNYALTTPFYGAVENITSYYEPENECARPGYYSVEFNDIFCELTVNEDTALHRYHFNKEEGRVAVDFSNDGLSHLFPERFHGMVKDVYMEKVSCEEVLFSGVLSGVKLYFCVTLEAPRVKSALFAGRTLITDEKMMMEEAENPFGVVFDFDGRDALVKVSYSTLGFAQARSQVAASKNFQETADIAYEVWNKTLAAIDIRSEDEDLKKKFYSALYHSLIKPCDMTGEKILGISGDLVGDLGTFWDQYKTLYPLIFLVYPQMGEKIVKAIANISRSLGKIPCSLGLTDLFRCEMQAKMLGILTLCDAHHCGSTAADPELIGECVRRELEREDFRIFLESGVFERYTHIIDTTDACLAAAGIVEDEALRETLLKLAKNWVNAYDEDGLMSRKSVYYEGDRYTYSFRIQNNMEERVALAGGKERFCRLLDDFFGFNGESLKQLTYLGADEEINRTSHHRFEGFNNECDMETPYAYIFAGRQERLCDIVRESVEKSFTSGKGGLPGNNDSGGLTSCLIWNMLGIFPATGTGEFLIGFPQVDEAVISLGDGKTLEIEQVKEMGERNGVTAVCWNGESVENYRIPMKELAKGGKLTIKTLWK